MDKVDVAIVCFSGGHSSALSAIEAVRKYGKNNVILLNHDISSHVEHEDIKRFKEDIANYCGVDITYANEPDFEDKPPLKVCIQHKTIFAGRPGMAVCTYELKTKPFYEYLEKIPKSPTVRIIYGFDMEEPDRIYRRTDIIRAMGYSAAFPLAYWDRTIERTEDVGIPRPSTYRLFKHANCAGCLKAGRQHWYCVYCLRPDIFEEAKQAEAQIGYSIIKDIYLEELEPKYKKMRDELQIHPNDKTNSSRFWAMVDEAMPEQISLLPCDCSY